MKHTYFWASAAVIGLGAVPAIAQDVPEVSGQAPALAEMVASGDLPPASERVGEEPLVVEPIERVGQYGGTWRSGLRGGGDEIWLVRTVGYEGLVSWDREFQEVVPNIAKSWEVNEDATEFTFNVREGMKWSDGTPYTARDVVFGYTDIIVNPEFRGGPQPWYQAGGEPGVAEAVDDLTLKFTFEAPNGLFLRQLANAVSPSIAMYQYEYCSEFHPAHNEEAEALASEAGFDSWVGLMEARCGVYNDPPRWQNVDRPSIDAWLTETPYTANATQVTLTRNPYYWKVDTAGNQLPYIDRLELLVSESVEDITLRALNGEIDFQDRHIATLQNKPLFFDGMEAGGFRLFDKTPDPMNTMVIMLNQTHPDPVLRELFDNKDFRIALSLGMDRQEIIDTVYISQGEPYQAAPRRESPLFNEQLATQYTEHDPEEANRILDELGYEMGEDGFRIGPDGERIRFDVSAITARYPDHVDALELIRQQWAEIGIDMTPRIQDRSLVYDRKAANQHDAMVWLGDAGLSFMLDPRYMFPFNYESGQAIAWAYYFDGTKPDLAEEPPAAVQRQQELYRQLQAEPDSARQDELMAEIIQIAADEFRMLGVSSMPPTYGIVAENMRNIPVTHVEGWIYPNPGPLQTSQFFFE